MRFARLARKFEGLQFGHRFLSNWMNCLGVIVQSVLKDFYLEDSIYRKMNSLLLNPDLVDENRFFIRREIEEID